MSEFLYINPPLLNSSYFGGQKPSDNYRVKSPLMLLGQGIITDKTQNKKNLRYSFLTIPYQIKSRLTVKDITMLFPGYNKSEINNFIKDNFSRNLHFHKNMYSELISALGYFEKNINIASFVYIYRLIEHISLCLPMLSLMQKNSFFHTFNDYKQLIDTNAKSDLSVLKKYSENVLNSSYGDVVIQFDFTNSTKPQQNVEILRKLIPNNIQTRVIVSSTSSTFEIKFKHIHILIISFRNEYFHYLFHEKNIGFDSLEYPEEFLKVCNPLFLNYIAYLFYELFTSELNLWG